MSAQAPSRDHIPHAHLMRAVLNGHYLQWFCRSAMKWESFATQTQALQALLDDDGLLVRIEPAADVAIGAAASTTDVHLMAPTAHLTWWPRHGQTVYRADPEGPTGSEPMVWEATGEQRLCFERHLLYADEYSAMTAWRHRQQQVRAAESNVIYCEFDKSLPAASCVLRSADAAAAG